MEPVDNKSFSQGAAGDRVADKSSGSVGVVGAQAGATVGRVSDGVFRQESQSAPRSVQGFESAPQPVQGLEPAPRSVQGSQSAPQSVQGLGSTPQPVQGLGPTPQPVQESQSAPQSVQGLGSTPQPVQGLEPTLREKPQSVSGPVQNPGFASLGSAQSFSQPEQSSEPTPQEDSSQVSQQEQKPGHMTDEEFYASFSNPVVPVNSAEGDIILNNGVKRRKKGLIIGAIVAGVGLVIGLMVLIFVVLPAMDPKTGDGIKAKNYQEAFNIYANYFLFGVRSKEAVDWDATKEEGFESYFEMTIDKPYEIKEIASGQETVGGVITKASGFFDVFKEMFPKDKEDYYGIVDKTNQYSKKLEFLDKFYNVGLPMTSVVLEEYLKNGYGAADALIWQIAESYRDVGKIYNEDVADLIGRYGDTRLAIIEEYGMAGCIVGREIDHECVSNIQNDTIKEYSSESANRLDSIFAVLYSSKKSTIRELSGLRVLLGDYERLNSNKEKS